MGKKIDLTGQQFGYLTVIEDTGERSNGNVVWLCECQCGNKKKIRAGDLYRNGRGTKSCGCFLKEKNSIDMKGKRFGKLIVLEDSGERVGREIKWKCLCDCGNIVNIAGSSLRDGNTKSCGCIRRSYGEELIKKILKENNINFKQEKTFDNCRFEDTNALARFDFYINNKYIIEFDGILHYEITNGWGTAEHVKNTQEHDKFKNEYCFNNNIPIIRIPYTHLEDLCLEDLLLETSKFILKRA